MHACAHSASRPHQRLYEGRKARGVMAAAPMLCLLLLLVGVTQASRMNPAHKVHAQPLFKPAPEQQQQQQQHQEQEQIQQIQQIQAAPSPACAGLQCKATWAAKPVSMRSSPQQQQQQQQQQEAEDDSPVVHFVVSNHLDVGYTALDVAVLNQYFSEFLPRAVRAGVKMEGLVAIGGQ
jgi:hypothetical protein